MYQGKLAELFIDITMKGGFGQLQSLRQQLAAAQNAMVNGGQAYSLVWRTNAEMVRRLAAEQKKLYELDTKEYQGANYGKILAAQRELSIVREKAATVKQIRDLEERASYYTTTAFRRSVRDQVDLEKRRSEVDRTRSAAENREKYGRFGSLVTAYQRFGAAQRALSSSGGGVGGMVSGGTAAVGVAGAAGAAAAAFVEVSKFIVSKIRQVFEQITLGGGEIIRELMSQFSFRNAIGATHQDVGGTLSKSFQILAASLGNILIPVVLEVSKWLQDMAQAIRNLSPEAKEQIRKMVRAGIVVAALFGILAIAVMALIASLALLIPGVQEFVNSLESLGQSGSPDISSSFNSQFMSFEEGWRRVQQAAGGIGNLDAQMLAVQMQGLTELQKLSAGVESTASNTGANGPIVKASQKVGAGA